MGNREKKAAITAAIIAYLEQEELAKITTPRSQPTFEVSPYQPAFEVSSWRLFGRQELMRSRLQWRQRIK